MLLMDPNYWELVGSHYCRQRAPAPANQQSVSENCVLQASHANHRNVFWTLRKSEATRKSENVTKNVFLEELTNASKV